MIVGLVSSVSMLTEVNNNSSNSNQTTNSLSTAIKNSQTDQTTKIKSSSSTTTVQTPSSTSSVNTKLSQKNQVKTTSSTVSSNSVQSTSMSSRTTLKGTNDAHVKTMGTYSPNSVAGTISVSISASRSSADLGQSVTFSVSYSTGGTGPWYITYSVLPTGCSSQNTQSLGCTPTATGSWSVTATVIDSSGTYTGFGTLSSPFVVYSVPTLSTPTANPITGTIDQGQTVTFSTSVSGGHGSYQYTWYGLPGCSSQNTNVLTCVTGASGTFGVSVHVLDANGVTAASGTLSYYVYPRLTASQPTGNPISGGIDVGQSVTFSTTAGGGKTGYNYVWHGLPGCASVNANSFSCTTTQAGTYGVYVTVTDANSNSVNSNPLSYQVYTKPSVISTTASPSSGGVDVGQSISFSSSISGGKAPYSYVWKNLPGCPSVNSNSLLCTTTQSGTFSVYLTVTDANGGSVDSATINYVVHTAPTVGTATANVSSGDIDAGQPVLFTSATPSGGVGPYSYSWTGVPTGCSDSGAASLACTPTASGTYLVNVTITDQNGFQVTSSPLSFSVLTQPSVISFTATRTTLDLNQNVTFTVIVSGGLAPYTYAWTLPSGCTSANVTEINCYPNQGGLQSAQVSIVDSNGFNITSSSIGIAIYSDPTVGSPTSSIASGGINVGQSVDFTSATPSGGLSPYTYSWTSLLPGCSDSGSSTVTCTPTASGTYDIIVQVTDANGYQVSSVALSFEVLGPPSISSFTEAKSTIDLNQNVTFTVDVMGGSSPYSYSWNLPTGCVSTNTNTINCIPTATGTFTVNVTVTDANNYILESSKLTLTVLSDPTVTTPSASISSGNIDVGQSVTYSTSASAGSGGYSYTWFGLPTGCSTSNANTIDCTPTTAGTFSISVAVTDSNGYQVTSLSLTYVVYSAPSVALPSASPSTIDIGQNVVFTVSPTGGNSPYSYQWIGLPAGCTDSGSNTVSCTPIGTGSFNVKVNVTDTNGFEVSSPILVFTVYSVPTVTQPAPSSTTGTVGTQVTFSTTGSGGYGTLTYDWSSNSTGLTCIASTTNTVTCTPQTAGAYSVTVTVTDANGVSASATSTAFTVSAPQTSSISVSTSSSTPGTSSSSTPSNSETGSSSEGNSNTSSESNGQSSPGFTSLLTLLAIILSAGVLVLKRRMKLD